MTSVNSELINQQGTATDFEIGKLPTGKYKLELFNIEGKEEINNMCVVQNMPLRRPKHSALILREGHPLAML